MKNFIISQLLDFLDETDEQYRINEQSHVEMMDGLVGECLNNLRKFWLYGQII